MTQEEFHKRYQYNPNTDCLGEGGFGKVFKAYDTHRDRWVAIKMAEVKPQLEEVRLKKEVGMIKKLPTHPNIAYYEECYTFSTFAGEYDFGILQYYELGNLQQLLTANQLTDGQKDSLLRQILEGIGFLHSQGIIHRDIKPQNILIVNRNGEFVPKITDFGISKKLEVNKSSVFTNSIAGAGTLAYASPEQLCGQTIKKNTDLWSFGVIVYWIFLGKLPFNTGDTTVTSEAGRIELFKQITKGEIPGLVNQLNSPWNEIVKQCLLADNEKRLTNVWECSSLLEGKAIRQEVPTTVQETTKLETKEISTNVKIKEQKSVIWKSVVFAIMVISLVVVALFWKNGNTNILSAIFNSKVRLTSANGIKVMDVDGNEYNTIRIGDQIWMMENLKTTKYNDGTKIPNITDATEWKNCNSGAYCEYNNEVGYVDKYGRLYNFYAVETGKLAPKGWHIPSKQEWETLENFAVKKGYSCFTGDHWITESKLPEVAKSLASKSGWISSMKKGAIGNTDYEEYRNKIKFSALPGGWRAATGKYMNFGEEGLWCIGNEMGRYFKLAYDRSYSDYGLFIYLRSMKVNVKNSGISIRCIKDN